MRQMTATYWQRRNRVVCGIERTQPQTIASPSEANSGAHVDISALTTEVEQLRAKVRKLEQESEQIKKQFNQLVGFIKQKLS